jgi:Fe-S-cluster containining protein
MTTFWLTTHLPYACRHSGACCSSGWSIPVERDRARRIAAAMKAGVISPAPAPWLQPGPRPPDEVAGVLMLQASGACIFHHPAAGASPAEPGCTIHTMRPASCEHFPHVCVTDPRGVHVTLSHYCPAAADLLFENQAAVDVVSGPPVLDAGRIPEGLDARESLPPVRESRAAPAGPMLMSWAEVSEWERALVRQLASDTRVPGTPDLARFDAARHAVQAGLAWPSAPDDTGRLWREQVAPAWRGWTAVVGRYLAARAHASWAMCLGRGPADVREAVATARAVLQVEAVRQCAERGTGALDRGRLRDAIRQSDLLLVHLRDPWIQQAPAQVEPSA